MGIFDDLKKMFIQVDEVKDLRDRIKTSPADPVLHQKLAERLIKRGEYSSAIEEYYTAATLFEKGGFGLKSIAVFKQCLKVDPANLETVKRLITALVSNGLRGDAIFEFERIIENKDFFPSEKIKEDFIGFSLENLGDAVEIHTYLIKENIKGNNKIAVLNSVEKSVPNIQTKKQFEKLSSLVERAAESFSSHGDIYEAYSLSLLAGGFKEEGFKEIGKLDERGSLKADDLPLDELRQHIDKVGSDPDLPRSFTSVIGYLEGVEEEEPEEKELGDSAEGAGGVRVDSDDFEEVLGKLREKVETEIGEEDLNARYNLGIAFKEMGLFEDAIREFGVSKADEEIYFSSMLMLKECYESMGNYDDAIVALEELLEAGTEDDRAELELLYQKGSLYEKMGNMAEAKEYFLKVFELDSNFKDVSEKVK